MIKGGLKKLEKDRSIKRILQGKRDFKLGEITQYPSLDDLPESFSLSPLSIMDQGADKNEDFCSAYMTAGMSAIQEGATLYPPFNFAASKAISGDIGSFGQDLRTAMAACTKSGSIETAEGRQYDGLYPSARRDFKNYSDESKTKALQHLKGSYVSVKVPKYDWFDSIRAAIWLFRAENRAAGYGVEFGWDLSEYILSGTPDGSGHAMYAVGWDKDGLDTVNSYGLDAGKQGRHRVTRETINAYCGTYGAYMFIDADPEYIKEKLLERKLTILQRLVLALQALLVVLKLKQAIEKPMPEPIVTPPHASRIPEWAQAIKEFEGWYPGSRSYRNNNPGNLKFADQAGTTGADPENHAVFSTYEAGWAALIRLLTNAATGKSKVYSPEMTLYNPRYPGAGETAGFYQLYAEGNSAQYATYVIKKLGITNETKIKELV